MKAITASLLILSTVLTIHYALGASTPDRAAGVDAGHWIPVCDKMGFVVTTPGVPGALVTTDRQPLLLCHRQKVISWCIPCDRMSQRIGERLVRDPEGELELRL
jgi:hypothetical protein